LLAINRLMQVSDHSLQTTALVHEVYKGADLGCTG
jgi:hypothetical protein